MKQPRVNTLFNIIYLSVAVLFILGCGGSEIGEIHSEVGSTNEPEIFISDSIYSGDPRPIPKTIYFYQDADTGSTNDDYQYITYLSAKGGTINSGDPNFYQWELESDVDWLNIGKINGRIALYTQDENGNAKPKPEPEVAPVIYITVTSTDENKTYTHAAKVVVLANKSINPDSPWQSSSRANLEYENGTGGTPDSMNLSGKDLSNDCTVSGNYFEWLGRGNFARQGKLQGPAEIDCYRIQVVEEGVDHSIYIEELNHISKPDNITCPDPTERTFNFLLKIGKKQGTEWCADLDELSEIYTTYLGEDPQKSGANQNNYFPKLEQRSPVAIAKVVSEGNSIEQFLQAARCDANNNCTCDPPEGALSAQCYKIERLPGAGYIWRLSFVFSKSTKLRNVNVAPYNFLESTDVIHAGAGDYFIYLKNESTTAISTYNYKIYWNINEN